MKVKNITEAWNKADIIFPTDYIKDDARSARAGYDIYYSTAKDTHAWISDLGNRLEVNLDSGETVNIRIEEEPQFTENEIAYALDVITEAICKIGEIRLPLMEKTGISEAKRKLYGAYEEIAKILKKQHPDSKIYDEYYLEDTIELYRGLFYEECEY